MQRPSDRQPAARGSRPPAGSLIVKVFLGTLVIALAGLFAPGVYGAVILYAVVAALAWLMTKTWAATPPPMLVFRLVMLALFAAIATVKLLG